MDFLNQKFYYNTFFDWLIAAAIILATVVIAKLVYWVLRTVIKKLTQKTKSTLDDILLESLQQPVVFGMAVFGIWFAFDNLHFPNDIKEYIDKAYFFLIIINFTWVIARVVAGLIEEYIVPVVKKSESDLDDQLLPVIRKTLKILIWTLGVIIALNNVGFNVGAVLAGMGIGGLALAMAAKDTVSNLFGGIMIFTDKPFIIRDRVQIEGYDGTVEEIGVRSTRLRTLAGRIITIPNAKFTDGIVENVSSEPTRKVSLNLGLTYDTPHEKMELAMKILSEINESNPHVRENPIISFNAFGDFSLGILFIYYILKGEDILGVQTEMNMEILKQFNANGLEFAFPTQTIQAQILK
ncbi:MAG: mechanosensitive ion channel family protein [Bacteroidales bacterium]|nr:mechanosensitive ion channel family protein [Bacteroidales bacterium]